jgi:hypothetical protein
MCDGELDRTIRLRPSYGSGPGGSGDLIPGDAQRCPAMPHPAPPGQIDWQIALCDSYRVCQTGTHASRTSPIQPDPLPARPRLIRVPIQLTDHSQKYIGRITCTPQSSGRKCSLHFHRRE